MSLHRMFAATLNSPVARAFIASALITLPGCAVTGTSSTPTPTATPMSPRDDGSITAIVKEKFQRNTTIDADAIGVQTRNGRVTLSGVARSATERTMAETLARSVSSVKSVANEIVVRH